MHHSRSLGLPFATSDLEFANVARARSVMATFRRTYPHLAEPSTRLRCCPLWSTRALAWVHHRVYQPFTRERAVDWPAYSESLSFFVRLAPRGFYRENGGDCKRSSLVSCKTILSRRPRRKYGPACRRPAPNKNDRPVVWSVRRCRSSATFSFCYSSGLTSCAWLSRTARGHRSYPLHHRPRERHPEPGGRPSPPRRDRECHPRPRIKCGAGSEVWRGPQPPAIGTFPSQRRLAGGTGNGA